VNRLGWIARPPARGAAPARPSLGAPPGGRRLAGPGPSSPSRRAASRRPRAAEPSRRASGPAPTPCCRSRAMRTRHRQERVPAPVQRILGCAARRIRRPRGRCSNRQRALIRNVRSSWSTPIGPRSGCGVHRVSLCSAVFAWAGAVDLAEGAGEVGLVGEAPAVGDGGDGVVEVCGVREVAGGAGEALGAQPVGEGDARAGQADESIRLSYKRNRARRYTGHALRL
jgi:hypothetical protein